MFASSLAKPKSAPPQRSAVGARRPGHAAVAPGQVLQRTVGHQAMPRFLAQHASVTGNEHGSIQAGLKVGAVHDPLEHEADRVAEQVTRMPAAESSRAAASPQIGRASAARGESELQMEPASSPQAAGEAPASVHDELRAGGRPLDGATRAYFEPRFGNDFGDVRVHTGASAEQSARDVSADAYTVGHDIVLGAGRSASGTPEGQRLMAHELTHVVQQTAAGPSLQRDPKPDARADDKSKDTDPKLTPFVSADLVQEIKRDNETWMLTINGHSDPDRARHLIWPYFVPPGITISLKVAILDPIERGWFVLDGLTPDAVKFMEPSIGKLFSDHGLVEEAPESEELHDARIAFLKRHSDYSYAVQLNMIVALDRITKRNPELLIAYYNYYADNNLRDETKWNDHISSKDYNPDRDLGATAYGGTIINPSVLDLTSKFPTSDPTSLLAGTLIHEFIHTPQGGGDSGVAKAPQEAKAYAIELFFSERMGDQKRADVINGMSWNSPVDLQTGADKKFQETYNTIRALYQVIDQGGPAAKDAREMSVEFISKNEDDFGTKLQAFIAKIP
jgi:hypothetical protein